MSFADLLLSSTQRLHTEMNAFVYEIDGYLILEIEAPFVEKKNIQIDFFNNRVTVKILKNKPNEDELDILANNIIFGEIKNTFTLPISVTDRKNVETSLKNGVLTIKINRRKEERNAFRLFLESED